MACDLTCGTRLRSPAKSGRRFSAATCRGGPGGASHRSSWRECERQEESCLYTSTALFEWLKDLRVWRLPSLPPDSMRCCRDLGAAQALAMGICASIECTGMSPALTECSYVVDKILTYASYLFGQLDGLDPAFVHEVGRAAFLPIHAGIATTVMPSMVSPYAASGAIVYEKKKANQPLVRFRTRIPRESVVYATDSDQGCSEGN